MNLVDNLDFRGEFSIKSFKKDGSIEEYNDKNLIMDLARVNMAELVGGLIGVDELSGGMHITQFVLGNKGHVGENILDYKLVGSDGFLSTRDSLFSEVLIDDTPGAPNFSYSIDFDIKSLNTEYTDSASIGKISQKGKSGTVSVDTQVCSVKRTIVDRTCTFEVTIPDYAGNPVTGDAVAYTEAALYAGNSIFSMKTFPARVKEDTVKFIITWSIIF